MDEYLTNRVLTASPQQLHLMVVEACLRHTRTAETALAAGDLAASHVALDNARRHLAHLMSGLDPLSEDDFMLNLRGLFKLAFRQLTLADIDHRPELVATAARILSEHRETWLLVMEQTAGEDAHASVPAPRLAFSA